MSALPESFSSISYYIYAMTFRPRDLVMRRSQVHHSENVCSIVVINNLFYNE